MIIFGALPVALVRPEVGILLYSWVSYMYPQHLAHGFAYDIPFAFITGAVSFAAWIISKEKKAPPAYTLNILIMVMAVWISITTVFAWNPDSAQREWAQAVKMLAVAVLTTILMQDRRKMTWLIAVIVASLSYYALRGTYSAILNGGHNTVWGPDGSLIAENNALALATLATIPLIRFLHLQMRQKWLRLAFMGVYPVFFLSTVCSYSRGALLGMSVMLVYLVVKSRRRFGLGIVVVAGVVGVLSFMPDAFFERMNTVETYQEDDSAQGRLNAWYYSINLALDNPIMGGGFKVSRLKSTWHYAPNPDFVYVAHSIYFQMLQSQGFVGLFLFLAIIYLAMRYGKSVIRRTRDRPDLAWLRDLASMSQVALVGYCAGGAFLSLAFYDLFWHLISFLVICRAVADRELAKAPPVVAETATAGATRRGRPPVSAPGHAAPAPGTQPAPAHRQFLRVPRGGAL